MAPASHARAAPSAAAPAPAPAAPAPPPPPPPLVVCAPGSHARFTFSESVLTGAARLDAVEFGFALLPRAHRGGAAVPSLPLLYASLASHPDGIAVLRAAGHIPPLLSVALGVETAETAAMRGSFDAAPTGAEQRRAALLALGLIGASPAGYEELLLRQQI
jgi:hypothetical protein